ncbi:hypothetical protein ABZ078_32260 [Streptomyces sp. NPDC006385]|uniref:hypothetical protein n=1 Tax=Streptomyces sp. NPDC006385 TaxID=3156761 RepID=UPI0033B7FAD8
MPADEVTHGADVEASRVRTGPRHAAPKKPLFTRFHMPAGKAIALAAMPTAVLMGMGFTSTLAQADSNDASKLTSNSLKANEYDEFADEYKQCVAALDDSEGGSASPSPSSTSADDSAQQDDTPEPKPSATADQGSSDSSDSSDTSGSSGSSGDSSSSDSGSDDAAEPTPAPSPSKSSEAQSGDTATPSPSPSESGGNLLEDIGDAITGVFTGGAGSEGTASPTPTPTPSPSAGEETSSGSSGSSGSSDSSGGKDTSAASDPVKETTEKVTDTVKDTVEGATGKVSEAAQDATGAAGEAGATPSPSASPTKDPEDCPAATDDESGVDNKVPVADDPWYLHASSLLLKGADYQGVVEVKTANGTTKKVLKYVISDGTDIGDLHQLVKDKQSGKTYHVQAAKGSTSTIRNGDTVMYTESISGNLLGLIPVTFDPEHPPPLNIPLIYFTNVKVTQAAQFGGTLHVPGMHMFTTD